MMLINIPLFFNWEGCSRKKETILKKKRPI